MIMNRRNENVNSVRGSKMKRLINRIGTYFEAAAFAESGDFETARLIMNENTFLRNRKYVAAEKRLNVSGPRTGLRRMP